jgi:hypothetical protein
MPVLTASGRFEPDSGTLTIDAEIVGIEQRTARWEACEETEYWPWWVGFGAAAAGLQIAALLAPILDDSLSGVLLSITLTGSSLPPALTAMILGIVDGLESPDCRVVEEPFPPGPDDDRVAQTALFVRADRPSGRTIRRSFPDHGRGIEVALEPDLYSCPPDCSATTARIAADAAASVRVERLAVTVALPDPELFGTEPPSVGFDVDIPLMPEGWSAPSPAPPAEPPLPPPLDGPTLP